MYEIIFGWQNPCHISDPEFEDVHITLNFNGDSSTRRWSTKIWKKIAKFHFRKWWFHGQNADFQATKNFLQEIFFKYKLHIITPSTALNFVHRNSFPKLPNFHNILLNFAKFRGRPIGISKSMQIPKKRIETVGIHVQTVGTC